MREISGSLRATLLIEYARALEEAGNPVALDPVAREQALANAEDILDDVARAVRTGFTDPGEGYRLLAREIGASRAKAGVHPEYSLAAASVWFKTVVQGLATELEAEAAPDSVALFASAVLGLERSISLRVRESSAGYAGYLLNVAREARAKERRSIVRDLHDRLGYGLSVAQRHLELFGVHWPADPELAAAKVEVAEQAIVDLMANLRSMISELHPPESESTLEQALLRYVDSAGRDDLTVRVQVNGDESWATPTVLDESFLILREAARNAFAHALAALVLIRVDIAPHELRGSVEDDGVGFNPHGQHGDGVGLITMRERARGLDGQLSITSRPGTGTRVNICIPF